MHHGLPWKMLVHAADPDPNLSPDLLEHTHLDPKSSLKNFLKAWSVGAKRVMGLPCAALRIAFKSRSVTTVLNICA